MQKYFLGSKYLKKNAELYQTKCEKEKLYEESHVSQKRNSAEKVPNKSYTHTAGATVVAAAAAAASTQCLKSIESHINSETKRSDNESLMRKNSNDESSVQRDGSVGNSVAIDLTSNPTEKISRTNGANPRVGKPATSIEPNSITRTLASLGPKQAHTEAEDASKIFGKSAIVVKETSASAGAVSGAENPETSSSTWLNWLNSSSTASSKKMPSPTEKPTLSNDKNKKDLSAELDTNEEMDVITETGNKNETKTKLPNGAVRIEGTISDSQER
jgi:hypothetical protein